MIIILISCFADEGSEIQEGEVELMAHLTGKIKNQNVLNVQVSSFKVSNESLIHENSSSATQDSQWLCSFIFDLITHCTPSPRRTPTVLRLEARE